MISQQENNEKLCKKWKQKALETKNELHIKKITCYFWQKYKFKNH